MQNQAEANKDVIPRETYEDEMEQMRREVQQCKEFIHAQQQLLQVRFNHFNRWFRYGVDSQYEKNNQICPLQQQLNTSFDDETAALLHDCYSLEDKERLKEEWRLFEEQKRNFERERKNFTEAAIRLGREVLELFLCVCVYV